MLKSYLYILIILDVIMKSFFVYSIAQLIYFPKVSAEGFDGQAVKFSDSASRQVYLALNMTLYPIGNPDTMDALGLSWGQIVYAPQKEFSLFKYVDTLNMYAAPGIVEQVKNELNTFKMKDEADKHKYVGLSYWNTSLFTANLSARYDYPDFIKYLFTIKMNRVCDAFNTTQLSKSSIVDSFLKNRFGPDEMVLFVEGPVLQAFVPVHIGCSAYSVDFHIPVEGEYWFKLMLLRTNFAAITDLVDEYAMIRSTYLIYDKLLLKKIVNRMICRAYWTAVTPNHTFDIPQTVTRIFGRPSTFERNINITTFIKLSRSYAIQPCANEINNYRWLSICQPMIKRKEAQTIVSGMKLLFIGDSHTRVLSSSFAAWICNFERTREHRGFSIDTGRNSTLCPNLVLDYKDSSPHCLPDLVPITGTYDFVVMNCAHHMAAYCWPERGSCEHYQNERFTEMVQNLATAVLKNELAKSEFVWMEANVIPLSNSDSCISDNDWRTVHRLQNFNRIATEIFINNSYDVMPAFSTTLPLSDKLCDFAHYTAPEALMPQFQWILRRLLKLKSDNLR